MYLTATIARHQQLFESYYHLTLQAPEIAAAAKPGQFVMLKAWNGLAPFLMRPISINSADRQSGSVILLYKVVGEGTGLLSAKLPGDTVQLLGPLGNGFPLGDKPGRIAVIGRGIGIAPLRYLVETALQRGNEVYAYLSAKTEQQLFERDYLSAIGAVVRCTTDSSQNVTDCFEKDLDTLPFTAAYSCGSNRLMREMHRLGKAYGFPTYASLESQMACGIGACKGCVCKTHDGNHAEHYETVCQCGPVFPTERII